MKGAFNAQDEFAKLVEDVRIGRIGRPISVGSITKFVPYRPVIDLNLPVFHVVGDHYRIPVEAALEASKQVQAATFHLPYPRCAYMMSLPGTHPGMKHLAPRFHVRHSYVVVCEEDDEGLHFIPFMRNELIEHWVRQLFDLYLPFGSDSLITMYDPEWGNFPADFIAKVETSLWDRVSGIMAFIYQMMNRRGEATTVPGTQVAEKINARRSKMQLPAVSGVITIDLDKSPVDGSGIGKGAGTPKKPHFRRGAWHTRKTTGQRSWHSPVAVHGGGEIVPPWYEIRTSI
jgi:hypothetical protein